MRHFFPRRGEFIQRETEKLISPPRADGEGRNPPPSAPRGDKSSIEIQSSLQFLRLIARLLLLYYYIDIRIKSEYHRHETRFAIRRYELRNDRNGDNKIPIKSP